MATEAIREPRAAVRVVAWPLGPAIVPILAATRVRLATVAAIRSWNRVFARPKYRAWRTPSWTSRANRCSTTWRRSRYSVKASLCCKARACWSRASWGCRLTVRPLPFLLAIHWERRLQPRHTLPSNTKPHAGFQPLGLLRRWFRTQLGKPPSRRSKQHRTGPGGGFH